MTEPMYNGGYGVVRFDSTPDTEGSVTLTWWMY